MNAKYDTGNIGTWGWLRITEADIRKFNFRCFSLEAYAGTKATTTGNSKETAKLSYGKDKVIPLRSG